MFKLLQITYDTFIQALFPLSPDQKWLLNTDVNLIIRKLPRANRSSIPESFSVFSYKDNLVKNLVWSIKYKKSKKAVEVAGLALYKYIKIFNRIINKPGLNDSEDFRIVLIPIPISKQRRRERGFNQCELILEEIKKLELKDYELKIERLKYEITFEYDLLMRKHHTSRQTLKDRDGRLKNAQDLFTLNSRTLVNYTLDDSNDLKSSIRNNINQTENIANQDEMSLNILFSANKEVNDKVLFIIIDDVVTTGGTMKQAVYTMRNAGFVNTWGLSVAH